MSLLILFLCSTSGALGLEGGKNIDQYGHDSWTFQNGLPGEAVPGGCRTRDGKLWFATRKGIVMVDPDHLAHNDLVPPVVIESVVADNETLSTGQELQLAPGKSRIEFHYTSLSLLIPARMQFKFKLEGYDKN